MRTLLVAAVLALPGVPHLIGFVVPWGIAAVLVGLLVESIGATRPGA